MIIWLASYPKSGNTLLRSMLTAYFYSKDGIFNFELLKNINQFPNQTLSIFIKPPSVSALEERLRARGTDSETALQERIQKAYQELKFSNQFDQLIVNDELEKSKKQIIEAVKLFIDE